MLTIRHIFFHQGFTLEELEKYGFQKTKYGDWELWIRDKLALFVAHDRRHYTKRKNFKPHLSRERCYAPVTIEFLSVIIKMAQDGMFRLFEETQLQNRDKKLQHIIDEVIKFKEEDHERN